MSASGVMHAPGAGIENINSKQMSGASEVSSIVKVRCQACAAVFHLHSLVNACDKIPVGRVRNKFDVIHGEEYEKIESVGQNRIDGHGVTVHLTHRTTSQSLLSVPCRSGNAC